MGQTGHYYLGLTATPPEMFFMVKSLTVSEAATTPID